MMNKFAYIKAKTIDEAVGALTGKTTSTIAGGTDILCTIKDDIYPDSLKPGTLISLNSIPGLNYIREEQGVLKIGALTRLADIASSDVVKNKYTALAQAAGKVASPQIRNVATIGGNICQINRCWYFRNPHNYFDCIRKGGNMCYAMAGDNRYHSIFGAVSACIAVNPSDTAPALVALNAKIVTNKRTVEAENFWDIKVPASTVLASDEIVTEIQVPEPANGTKSSFVKYAARKSFDFPIVNCAAVITSSGQVLAARIVLNAVYNKPYRAENAEKALVGTSIDENSAKSAGETAVSSAQPMVATKYKKILAANLVKQAILACK